MRVRSLAVGIFVVMLVVAACGDDDAIPFGSVTSGGSSPTTTTTTATTVPVTTTSTTVSTTSQPTTTAAPTSSTTTAPLPTAADALDGFFQAAAALDGQIRAAADLFNAGYDQSAATLSTPATVAIDALDATPLAVLVPPGLSLDLETAVLGVYADLNSRVAALQGAVRLLDGTASNIPYVLDCLANGGFSADRFDGDLAGAVALAAAEAPPTAAPDSVPAGVLAVRLEAIRSMNFGCDGCGGIAYTEAIPVDWDARTVIEGVEFEATFDGTGWQILIYAC